MRRSALLLIAILLSACKTDADGDGFYEEEDCDDANADVNPDATEVCDGIDNDCDKDIDEGQQQTWYLDADGDGYGSADASAEACAQPESYVDDATDCNDASADYHPGAAEDDCTDSNDYNCDGSVGYTDADGDGVVACEDCDDGNDARYDGADEVCDGIDNDCDNTVDEDPTDGTEWFIDYDEDGFGSDSYSVVECDAPADIFVDNSDDCDDFAALSNPDGTEVCDDLDNDCDGEVDGENAIDAQTYYVDLDGDGYGVDDSLTTTCASDDSAVDVGGDCDDGVIEINPGADEICNDGVDNDCDGDNVGCAIDLTDAQVHITGELAGDRLGIAMASVGDLDGDGLDDFVIGASGNDETATNIGRGYLMYGPLSSGEADVADLAVALISGDLEKDQLGSGASAAGDMNGDGYRDFALGAGGEDEGGTNSGAAYVFFGDGTRMGDSSASDANLKVIGDGSYDYSGNTIALAGDVNDDGFDDLLVGSYQYNESGGDKVGAAYLVLGGEDLDGVTLSGGDADARLLGLVVSDSVGADLAYAGDINGDGFDDLWLAAYLFDTDASATNNAGAAFVGLGPISGTMTVDTLDAEIRGDSDGDYLGQAIGSMGDYDSDGYADILVTAPRDDAGGVDAGAVYLLRGEADLSGWDDQSVLSLYTAQVTGASADQHLGFSVDGSGDLDGDGNNDLLVGAPDMEATAGAAFLFNGPLSGTQSIDDADAQFLGDDATDAAGSTVMFVGDTDGSGRDSVLIAADKDNYIGSQAGAAYLLTSIGF